MTGRWDIDDEKTLASELKRNKYFDAELMIDKIAREGVELNKLPEHFTLDEQSKKQLILDIEHKVDNMEGLDSYAQTIMGFLRGYAQGMREGTQDKKVIDL